MSMLAERKRKQKFSLNPRGNDWSNDSNKFGQKILQKMGWSKGKGLGAEENGIKEHIRVAYKNDSKGMGFKDTDQWTEHEKHFSELLQNLSNANDTQAKSTSEPSKFSLEEKSKNSRARVHYKKFTRGKDISKYSAKDLANIFGKTHLNDDNKDKETVPAPAVPTAEAIKIEDAEKASYNFSSGGSMTDYFKKKLSNLGKLNKIQEMTKVESDFNDERPTFTMEVSTPEKKKSKKTKRQIPEVEEAIDNNDLCTTPKKKRKHEKREDSPMHKNGISNPAFNPLSNPVKMKKHALYSIEECNEEVDPELPLSNGECELDLNKTKRKKRKYVETIDDQQFKEKPIEQHESSSSTVEKKKKSKKCKKENGLDNPLFQIAVENENSLQETDSHVVDEGNKKKHKKKQQNVEVIEIPEIITQEESKSTTKKKKKKKNEIGLDNPLFNSVNNEIEIKSNPFEISIRNANDENGCDNPVFQPADINTVDEIIPSNDYEVKRKNKSKKKQKKEEIGGVDNPGLKLNDTNGDVEEEHFDIQLNVVNEPLPNEQQQSMQIDPEFNIEKVTKLKRKKSVKFNDVTQEIIIPNGVDNEMDLEPEEKSLTDSIKTRKKSNKKTGFNNLGFDEQANKIDENINMITNTLDSVQAEVENDINEKKMQSIEVDDLMIGEVGNPDGNNEILADGSVKMKFKYAQFNNEMMPVYVTQLTGPRKSYKHLIRGDIILNFAETNLHEIHGYTYAKNKLKF